MDLNANIEGAAPLEDISGLIDPSIKTRDALCKAEYENILLAAEKYLAGQPSKRLAPFTLAWLKRLHNDMFGQVWSWAGRIRDTELNCGWCSRAYQIEEHLQNMIDDLKMWRQSSVEWIEQSALLHHRAVQIHPFQNGNGRWARMLANIHLRQNGAGLVIWPEQTIANTSLVRDEYLQAIRNADRGDHQPLIEFHRRFWKRERV